MITIEQVFEKMNHLTISRKDLCRDLGFYESDLSNYLNKTKKIPQKQLYALYWYFRAKELESQQ